MKIRKWSNSTAQQLTLHIPFAHKVELPHETFVTPKIQTNNPSKRYYTRKATHTYNFPFLFSPFQNPDFPQTSKHVFFSPELTKKPSRVEKFGKHVIRRKEFSRVSKEVLLECNLEMERIVVVVTKSGSWEEVLTAIRNLTRIDKSGKRFCDVHSA